MLDIASSRLCLIPGHKAELFCIAAEEAKELCVPIVSMGIGSLSERISNGKTGLIASNEKQFADFTIELMNNDALWNSMRNYMLEIRGSKEWFKIAKKFISELIT
jgi:glycosyltransferase involved in cell wall biosynthesis